MLTCIAIQMLNLEALLPEGLSLYFAVVTALCQPNTFTDKKHNQNKPIKTQPNQ
jgi:hypothetical protein